MTREAPPLFTSLPHAPPAPAPSRSCSPTPALFAVLASACFAISYGANVVLSITIVAMVNHTAIAGGNRSTDGSDSWTSATPLADVYGNSAEGECPAPPGHEADKDGPFVWDDVVQGYLRAGYFWGYLAAQVPGGLWAERRGAKGLLLAANAINIAGLLLTPAAAHAHWAALLAVRAVMGLAGAVTFPAMHVMISHWATAEQRGLIAGVVYGGTSLGTIGATLIGGYLASSLDWTWVFYILGLVSLPWCPLWALLVTERPNEELIPEEMREKRSLKFPTKHILCSCPFWAILITHFCNNCGWYLYLTELPGFMEEVLHKNIKENAGTSTVPYALMWVLNVSLGWGLDGLRKRRRLTTGAMRKIATSIASLVPCACLVGISFIGCNADAGTALMTVAVTACGGMFVGVLSNHIDIAPNFAGRLMAITNTIATIPGIAMPTIIGVLTEGQETLSRWSIAFYVTATLYGVMFVVFLMFASGDEQPWNRPPLPLAPEEDGPLIRAREDTLDPYDPIPFYGSLTVA